MSASPPIAMLAELTHRCPLACPYCSNPTELLGRENELDTETWASVFRQAAEMGVLQLHLSGGEPASRRDIIELTAAAHNTGLYTNLITSGIGLTPKRLDALEAAGLDHIQLSMQGNTA
jgi:pyrroloquinoline quinone biosynthesis protein E